MICESAFSSPIAARRFCHSEGGSALAVNPHPASAASKLIQDVVNAYNTAIGAINASTKYNAETDEPSALTGDAQMRSASGQLRNLMGNLLGDLAAQGLDAKTLGLQTKGYPTSDGTLVFDSSKFMARFPDFRITPYAQGMAAMAESFRASAKA